MKYWFVLVALFFTMAGVAHAAIDTTYEFADDTKRARFRELTQQLRCPKCQNQDIAESNAPIANDLRRAVYRMLREGKKNQQVLDFMVVHYGDFVLYRPALNSKTEVLWFGPFILLLAGLVLISVIVCCRRAPQAIGSDTLSVEERQHLDTLLDKTKDD